MTEILLPNTAKLGRADRYQILPYQEILVSGNDDDKEVVEMKVVTSGQYYLNVRVQ